METLKATSKSNPLDDINRVRPLLPIWLRRLKNALIAPIALRAARQGPRRPPGISFVVFSCDRPLQLDGLLRSLRAQMRVAHQIAVVFRTTSPEQHAAYDALRLKFGGVRFFPEPSFTSRVREALDGGRFSHTAFLVDDDLFIREVDFDLTDRRIGSAVVSLRLGAKINYSQPCQRAIRQPSSLRTFRTRHGAMLSWRWFGHDIDWGMPHCLDGNVFSTHEISRAVGRVSFKNPNTLEAALQSETWMYRFATGVCWEEPRLINIPANRVQTSDWVFPSGQESAEYLLKMWLDGYELNLDALRSVNASSCHIEMALPLKKRERAETEARG